MLNNISAVEWLGHTASVLVLISLSMKSLQKLRWFNLAGATSFAWYGYLIGAVPVATVNLAIMGINIFYLRQMYTRRDYFEILEVTGDRRYLTSFLKFHDADIRKWYPSFTGQPGEDSVVVLTLRDMAVAGVFIAKPTGDGVYEIEVDYVLPQYGDKKVGRHLYRDSTAWFSEKGIQQLTVDESAVRNQPFFRGMGFESSEDDRFLRLVL